MDITINIPEGFKELSQETAQKQFKKPVNSKVRLIIGEIIEPKLLIESEVATFKVDDNEYKSIRVLVASDKKAQRSLKPDIFFPFPKERKAFLEKSNYGKDVFNYPGDKEEFIKGLYDKKLVVKAIEDLPALVWVEGKQVEQICPFHIFEYLD